MTTTAATKDGLPSMIAYLTRVLKTPTIGAFWEELATLMGRVMSQRLDRSRPLWEYWFVEGLADGRWAMISKVHHCMVDGIAGTDLMQVIFDLSPDAPRAEPKEWTAQRSPSSAELLAGAVQDTVAHPLRHLASLPGSGTATRR